MLVEVTATRLSLADVQALAPHEVLDVLKDARIDHELSAWFCTHSITWIDNTTAESGDQTPSTN